MSPTHLVLSLHPLAMPLPAQAVKDLLLRGAKSHVTILEHVHLGLSLLFGLQGVDYLISVDSCELIRETLHEFVPPVFLQVSVEGTRLMTRLFEFFLIVLAQIPNYTARAMMCMETVIGMQPENIRLVRLLQVGHVKCAFVHVEVPLFLLVFGIRALEIDHPIALREVIPNNDNGEMFLLCKAFNQVNKFGPRAVKDPLEFIEALRLNLKQVLFLGNEDVIVIPRFIGPIVEVVIPVHRIQG